MSDSLVRAAELICDIEPSYGDCWSHSGAFAHEDDMHCRAGIAAAERLRAAGLLTEPEKEPS